MTTKEFRIELPTSWDSLSKLEKMLRIVKRYAYKYSLDEVRLKYEANADTTLGQLGVSTTSCDRFIRVLVNQLLRKPNDWSPVFPDTVKQNSKLSTLLKMATKEDWNA